MVSGRGRERQQRVELLSRDPQGGLACDQHGHPWTTAEDVGKGWRRAEDLLEVVEREQHPLIPQYLGKLVLGGIEGIAEHAECLCDRRQNQIRLPDRGQRHIGDVILELAEQG